MVKSNQNKNRRMVRLRNLLFMLSVLAFLGIPFNSECQEFSQSEMKIINKSVDSILNLYAIYSTFTEDDREISTRYVNKFKELFNQKDLQRSILTDDLKEPSEGKYEDISPEGYIKWVKNKFKEGLGIKISNVTKYPPKKKKDHWELKVHLTKKVFGYRKSGDKDKLLSNELPLIITMHFDHPRGNYTITSIYSEDLEKFWLNKSSSIEIGINVLLGYSFLSVSSDLLVQSIKSSGGFSIGANLYFAKYFKLSDYSYYGVGIGVGTSSFSYSIEFDSFFQSESDETILDRDGDAYSYLIDFSQTTETYAIQTLDIYFYVIRYRNYFSSNGYEFFLNSGLKYSNVLSYNSKISGLESTKGRYFEEGSFDLLLDEVDYYGYVPNSSFDSDTEINFSDLYSFFLQTGLSKSFGSSLVANLGINFDLGFSNMVKESQDFLASREDALVENNHSSILHIANKSKPYTIGLFLGFAYRF